MRPELTPAAALDELEGLLRLAAPSPLLPFASLANGSSGSLSDQLPACVTKQGLPAGDTVGSMSDAEFRNAYIPRRLADLGDEEEESRRLAGAAAAAAAAPFAHYAAVTGMDLSAAREAAVAAERASRSAAAAIIDDCTSKGGAAPSLRRRGAVRASDVLRQMGLDAFGQALPQQPNNLNASKASLRATIAEDSTKLASAVQLDADHAEQAEKDMAGCPGWVHTQ